MSQEHQKQPLQTEEAQTEASVDYRIRALATLGLGTCVIRKLFIGSFQNRVEPQHRIIAQIAGPKVKPEEVAGSSPDYVDEIIGIILPKANGNEFIAIFTSATGCPHGLIFELKPNKNVDVKRIQEGEEILSGKEGDISASLLLSAVFNYDKTEINLSDIQNLVSALCQYTGYKIGLRTDSMLSGEELAALGQILEESLQEAGNRRRVILENQQRAANKFNNLFDQLFGQERQDTP